jgi:hypothetical protein
LGPVDFGAADEMSTVWIYTDTSKQVGDVIQLKVFGTPRPSTA